MECHTPLLSSVMVGPTNARGNRVCERLKGTPKAHVSMGRTHAIVAMQHATAASARIDRLLVPGQSEQTSTKMISEKALYVLGLAIRRTTVRRILLLLILSPSFF